MKEAFVLAFCILFIAITAGAQTSVTVTTGGSWKDALLLTSARPSEVAYATTNYNTYPRIAATTWTHAGSVIQYRSLLRFELGVIPTGSVVQSAVLYLKSDPANAGGEISNDPLSGSNALFVEKVMQAWDAATVTWNTQPPTTTANRVLIDQSLSYTENIQVNITGLVQEMVNGPATNYGIMLKLQNEVQFRSRSYASTDHANAALHPRLEIVYTPAAYYCIKDGDWNDAIWSADPNATTGIVLPTASATNINGHTVTLKGSATVKTLSIGAANGLPGVLVLDGGNLTSTGQLTVASTNAGNKIQVLNNGKLNGTPVQ